MLGVLLIYFDVATAMILFSIIQLAANGWRAVHWWSFVRWDIFWRYCVGGAVAFAVLRLIDYVPDKAMVYLLLGLMPFAVEALPESLRPNIEWRGVPFVTGFFTTIIQFISGVGGPFLDIFFQKSSSTARPRSPPRRWRRPRATPALRLFRLDHRLRYRPRSRCR